MPLNETHDPQLRSWLASANALDADFPVQNLPFGAFRRARSQQAFRIGVAIGDQILDLTAAHASGALSAGGDALSAVQACFVRPPSMPLDLGPTAWSALRLALSRALRAGSPLQALLAPCLLPQQEADYAVPARIGDYTDFYTSVHHATNIGKLLRPDNPLLPNYKWLPIGYHGRSSSIVISGQPVHRPVSQVLHPGASTPVLAASARLDYELEVGVYLGRGNALGEPIALDQAEQHVFGLCLFNDWSARDVQGWEYQPLGPFLSKNFASSVSPWVVTLEALAPYRQAWTRPGGDPQPLPYLDSAALRRQGAIGIECRSDDVEINQLLSALHDPVTSLCVSAERAMNARLNGGCQVPIAGFAELRGDHLFMRGLVGSPDGSVLYRAERSGSQDQAENTGRQIAEELLALGADKILQALFH